RKFDVVVRELLAQCQLGGIHQLLVSRPAGGAFRANGSDKVVFPRVKNHNQLSLSIALCFHLDLGKAAGIVESLHGPSDLVLVERLVPFLLDERLQPLGMIDGSAYYPNVGYMGSLQAV